MSAIPKRALVHDLRDRPEVETAYRERDALGAFVEVVLSTPTVPASVLGTIANHAVDLQSLDHDAGHTILLLR
ncbi:MAG: hypothetical protein ABEJ58_05855 [Halodesulfurarchaeum sp.]